MFDKLLGDRLLTLFFPHKCFRCGKVLAGTGWLCDVCAAQMPETAADQLCPRCGKRTQECACARLEGGYDRAAAPFYYTDGVDYGVHRFKYGGRRYYAPFLADRMAVCVKAAFAAERVDCVAYVPMHPRKQRQRGFCQTELLAEELGMRLAVPVRGDLLRHTGKGGAQMELHGAQARRVNADCSFGAWAGKTLHGETVLLVDDVLTTGATARRCAELLKRLGAGRVFLIVIATTSAKKEAAAKTFTLQSLKK